jgi:hypothetical protein
MAVLSFWHLKLNYDESLPEFAFKFNLRRYIQVVLRRRDAEPGPAHQA